MTESHTLSTSAPADRLLVCIPRGGFNDMLCQLERCARYASAHKRQLVIDTSQSGLASDLFDYFDLREGQPRVRRLAEFEAELEPRRLTLTHGGARREWALPDPAEWETFDMTQEHPAPVLLHCSAGGGDLGVHFLERMRLKPALADRIAAKVAAAGKGYVAVHIRHTDYRTDFATAFRLIAQRMKGRRLLICSDSQAPIDHFRDTWGDRFEWSTSDAAKSTDDSPLHAVRSEGAAERAEELLTDLYLLACGDRLVMVDTENSKRSGFAVLAAHMLRRIDPARQGAERLLLRGRTGPWAKALARGNLFRVWRVRRFMDRPGGRVILHPTPE